MSRCNLLRFLKCVTPIVPSKFLPQIHEIAANYLGLMTLKNVDFHQQVGWYPIYHIPTQKNEKYLQTCFLAYHTLSSCFQGNDEMAGFVDEATRPEIVKEESGEIRLSPFGTTSYKMQGDLWINSDVAEMERLIYLHCAADSWLKQFNVRHHDYNFFTCHSVL